MKSQKILLVVDNVKTDKSKKPTLVTRAKMLLAASKARRLRTKGKEVNYCVFPGSRSRDASSIMHLKLALSNMDEQGLIILPGLADDWKSAGEFARQAAIRTESLEVYV
jgi:hypothetical protein